MTHPVLRTQRLLLRPLVAADAEAITTLIGDYEVSKWLTHVPHPYGLEDAHWFLGSDGNQPGKNWAIEWEGQFVGSVGCTKELGYWLGRPFWRNGIMTEAARAVVDAVFEGGADEIRSGYLPGNAGSSAILTGLGFQNTRVEQEHSKSQHRKVDVQKMRLTRSSWEARHG